MFAARPLAMPSRPAVPATHWTDATIQAGKDASPVHALYASIESAYATRPAPRSGKQIALGNLALIAALAVGAWAGPVLLLHNILS